MLLLRFTATFAAFRDGSTGYARTTMPFAPPSAVYGLLLNVAGVEMRGVMGLPSFRLALAAVGRPRVSTLYSQLHVVPVGQSAAEWEAMTKGSKPSISPARREILQGLDGYAVVEADVDLEQRIARRLSDEATEDGRYGLPFLGDNSFLLDSLEVVEAGAIAVDWLVMLREEERGGFPMTAWVDREQPVRTRTAMFNFAAGQLDQIPQQAWSEVGPKEAVR